MNIGINALVFPLLSVTGMIWICACAEAHRPPQGARTQTQLPPLQGITATQGAPITQEQAQTLASQYWHRLSNNRCGGTGLEKETALLWYYRVFEGYAGQPKGLIVVDKQSGETRQLDDYPPGLKP